MEPLVLVVVQEQMVQMEVVEHQLHQGVVVLQGLLGQVEVVDLVDVMVQEVRLDLQEQAPRQVRQQAQEVQELLLHLEVQDYLVIDIDQLLQLHLH
jgi:hypothetical protein